MKKITDINAAIRARLEAAGITGFRINTGLLSSGISQPDIARIITGNGDSTGARSFDMPPTEHRNWSLARRSVKLAKRAAALFAADIKLITEADLDALLAPMMHHGLIRTTYERCTGATEYRGPSGRVIACSIGSHHFARKDVGAFSLAMHAQQVGRIKRHTDASRPQ